MNDDIGGAPGRCRAGSHPGHRCGANCSESGRNDAEVHSPLRESRDYPSDQRILPGLCRMEAMMMLFQSMEARSKVQWLFIFT